MKKTFGKEIKVWALAALTLFSGAAFVSCDDEVDAENRFTFKGELISNYLENNPERFSSFCAILDKAKIGKKSSEQNPIKKNLHVSLKIIAIQ